MAQPSLKRLVLLGAGGDLAGRFLLPALASLHADGRLPEGFGVLAADLQERDDDGFRAYAAARLERHAPAVPAASRQALLGALRYRAADAGDPGALAGLLHADRAEPAAIYLALPQRAFAPAVAGLSAAALAPGSRVAVEKPFGEDLAGAVALNAALARFAGPAGERAVMRIDHVLGMDRAQDLLARRTAGRDLEPLLGATGVREVEILWGETLALEGRAGFYDRAGALRDVVQNHLLQLLALVAAEPASPDGPDLAARKLAALRAVRAPDGDDLARLTRRARYTAGRGVPAYTAEAGVDPARGTETFAEVGLGVATPRWAGTPFRLRAGKALGGRRRGVVLHPWAAGDAPVHLDFDAGPGDAELPAYVRVLGELLQGGATCSVSGPEAEEAWRIVTPVLDAWAQGRVPLQEYAAGTHGPPRA